LARPETIAVRLLYYELDPNQLTLNGWAHHCLIKRHRSRRRLGLTHAEATSLAAIAAPEAL
jgi:hypothetical protein